MINGIVHAGITVSDMEKSIKFYRDVLGLKVVKVEEEKGTRGERLGVPGAVIQVVMLETSNGAGMELIEYKKPAPPNKYGLPVNGLGQVHIAFKVDDIEAQIAKMEAAGVEFIGGSQYETIEDGPLTGWKWIYFKDPDGTNLELIQEA